MLFGMSGHPFLSHNYAMPSRAIRGHTRAGRTLRMSVHSVLPLTALAAHGRSQDADCPHRVSPHAAALHSERPLFIGAVIADIHHD